MRSKNSPKIKRKKMKSHWKLKNTLKRKELRSNKKKKWSVLNNKDLSFKNKRRKKEDSSRNGKDEEKRSSNVKSGSSESCENESSSNESPSKDSVLLKSGQPLFEAAIETPSSLLKDSLRSFRTQSHEIRGGLVMWVPRMCLNDLECPFLYLNEAIFSKTEEQMWTFQ